MGNGHYRAPGTSLAPLAKGAAVPMHFGPLEFVVWAEGIA